MEVAQGAKSNDCSKWILWTPFNRSWWQMFSFANTLVICLVVLLPNVKMYEISGIIIPSSETCNGRKISGTVLKFWAVARHFSHRSRLGVKRNCSREEWNEGKQTASTWCSEQIQCVSRSLALQWYSSGGRESIAELSVGSCSAALCYSCHNLLRWSEPRGAGAAGWWAKQGCCALNTSWGIEQLPLRNSPFNRNFESISFRGCTAQLPLLPFSAAQSRTHLTVDSRNA